MSNGGLISGAFSSTSGKADTVMNTNGQILYYNNGRKALDKEDNDDVLTLKSGLPSWETAGGGVTTNSITTTVTDSFSTTSSTFVAVTNMEIDLSDESGGMALVSTGGNWENTTADNNCQASIFNDGVEIASSTVAYSGRSTGRYMISINISANMTTDGSTAQLYCRQSSGGACSMNFGADSEGQLKAFEVY